MTTKKRQRPRDHRDDPLLTVSEVARRLGKSPTTVARWIAEGWIPAIRLPSRLWAVRESEVNRVLGNLQRRQP